MTSNGRPDQRLPNTLNISFNEVHVGLLLEELDRKGSAASAGSACSTGSRVLSAMGMDDSAIRSSMRFSLGRKTTAEDIDYVLDILSSAVGGLLNRGK